MSRTTRLCESSCGRPVRKRGYPEPLDRVLARCEVTPDGCWTAVRGSLTSDGYVEVRDRGRKVRGHRVTYEFFIGEVPDGLMLDHLCRVRACVNPWHLDPVTVRVNTLRGRGPTALAAGRINCPKGHAYEAAERGDRRRICRRCDAERPARARRT